MYRVLDSDPAIDDNIGLPHDRRNVSQTTQTNLE
jgi:hypothetical protein